MSVLQLQAEKLQNQTEWQEGKPDHASTCKRRSIFVVRSSADVLTDTTVVVRRAKPLFRWLTTP